MRQRTGKVSGLVKSWPFFFAILAIVVMGGGVWLQMQPHARDTAAMLAQSVNLTASFTIFGVAAKAAGILALLSLIGFVMRSRAAPVEEIVEEVPYVAPREKVAEIEELVGSVRQYSFREPEPLATKHSFEWKDRLNKRMVGLGADDGPERKYTFLGQLRKLLVIAILFGFALMAAAIAMGMSGTSSEDVLAADLSPAAATQSVAAQATSLADVDYAAALDEAEAWLTTKWDAARDGDNAARGTLAGLVLVPFFMLARLMRGSRPTRSRRRRQGFQLN
jgi:hypothetical protein